MTLSRPGPSDGATRLMERFPEVSFTHGAEITFDSDDLVNLATCDVVREQ
jgi:hypothetical protein